MRTIIILFTALMIVSCNDNIETLDNLERINKIDLEDTKWAGIKYDLNGVTDIANADYQSVPNRIFFEKVGQCTYGGALHNWTLRAENLIIDGIHKSTILEYDGETMIIEFTFKEGFIHRLVNQKNETSGEYVILKQLFQKMI